MNKYGGINDNPTCSKKVYSLWFNMLRRCYDKTQHERDKGKSYADCEVCEDWKRLSIFERDIKTMPNYENWEKSTDYVLDKDMIKDGNKTYSKETCCFITKVENIKDMNRRNPHVHNNRKTVAYVLSKDGKTYEFAREKDACEFLGVKQCTVSSCYRYRCKCNGYEVERAHMKGGAE
jgi:hypothetical protein